MATDLGVHDPESSKARIEYERMRQKAHKGSDIRKKFNGKSKPVFVRKSQSLRSSSSSSISSKSSLSINSDASLSAKSGPASPSPSPSSAKFAPQTPKSASTPLRVSSGSFSATSAPPMASSLMTPNMRRKHQVLWDEDDVTYLEATAVDVLVEHVDTVGKAPAESPSSSSAQDTDDDDDAEEKVYDSQTPRVVPIEQLVVTPKKKQKRLRGAQARRRHKLTIDFLTPAFSAINMGNDDMLSPLTVGSRLDDDEWEDYEFCLPGESSGADAGLLLMDMEGVQVAGKVSLLSLPDVDEEECDFDEYDEYGESQEDEDEDEDDDLAREKESERAEPVAKPVVS